MTVNLHLDGLRDRCYRGSVRVRNCNEFTLYMQRFGLPDSVLPEYDMNVAEAAYKCAGFLIIDYLGKKLCHRLLSTRYCAKRPERYVNPVNTLRKMANSNT